MRPPRVSIIIPCFNAARWIADALNSVLAQTAADCEIIVVNDGSRDGSLTIARGFESRGVQVIDQPNRGASAARNTGLHAARGVFIQFLDADDLLAPDKIARQLAVLESDGGYSLASGEWARFVRDPAEAEFKPQPNWQTLSGVELLELNYELGSMMHPAAWLAPRTLLDRAGIWDESLSLNDDGEYFARVALAAERVVFCPGARSYYRSGDPSSLSARKDFRSLQSYFDSVRLITHHLLEAANQSPRAVAAAAYGWKWAAFELYPGAPQLSREAEANAKALGGSSRPFPGSGRFQLAARFLGWRMAKRICC